MSALFACASAQSDQGLHCPLTDYLDTTECTNEEQRPGCYFTHAQDDLNLRILRMLEGTFSLDEIQMLFYWSFKSTLYRYVTLSSETDKKGWIFTFIQVQWLSVRTVTPRSSDVYVIHSHKIEFVDLRSEMLNQTG